MKLVEKLYDIHLSKAENLLTNARSNNNPAEWLYKNDLRTSFFMLEGLSRVYKKVLDKDLFDKLNNQFKQIEDGIGAADYYFYFANEITSTDEISLKIKQHLMLSYYKELEDLNAVLQNKGWLDGTRIDKIRKKIAKTEFLTEAKEVSEIKNTYIKTIDKIQKSFNNKDIKFKDIELDVHEVRRQLRWLSIYPQAFTGIFKFAHEELTEPHLHKYLTPDVVNSRYNVFPDDLKVLKPILLQRKYFYALSWVIAEIGNLKDEGLKIEMLEIAIKDLSLTEEQLLEINEFKELKNSNLIIEGILESAEKIIKDFVEEKNLKKLVS